VSAGFYAPPGVVSLVGALENAVDVRSNDAFQDGEGNGPYAQHGGEELGEIEPVPEPRLSSRAKLEEFHTWSRGGTVQEGAIDGEPVRDASSHTRLQQVTAPSALASSETSTRRTRMPCCLRRAAVRG
jgi:hypothetical protein